MFIITDDWLKTCQIADPNFEACSRESIQGLFKQLAIGKLLREVREVFVIINVIAFGFNLTHLHISKGIEGFTAIETIDPMKLNRIKIFQGEGPVSINSSVTKVSVTGFADTEVLESK